MAEQDFLADEMKNTEANLAAPDADEAASEAKDDRVWHNDEGAEVSKSEFIREQFTKHNKSRKKISEEFDINYRTVYGATVNMTNDAEPASRGRTASSSKIKVTADNKVVTVIEDTTHVDNVAVSDEDAAALGELTEVDRNTWIKEQVEGGRERGEVAKALGLSYGVVYGMTKEIEGNKQRHDIVDPDTNETISRSEYIRRLHERGMEKAAIAKFLNVEYPVVWSALKGTKTEDEKFADAIDRVAKFGDKVEDQASFNELLDMLRGVKLKAPVENESTEASGETVYNEAEGQA